MQEGEPPSRTRQQRATLRWLKTVQEQRKASKLHNRILKYIKDTCSRFIK